MNWLNFVLLTCSLHRACSSDLDKQIKAADTGRPCKKDADCASAVFAAKCEPVAPGKKTCTCVKEHPTKTYGTWTPNAGTQNPDADLSDLGGCVYEFDDKACAQAYEDRCFLSVPYMENQLHPDKNCCGKCNDGDHSQTCTWSYNEDFQINGTTIKLSGSFRIENDACERACHKLNHNTRQQYCDFIKKVTDCEAATRSVKDSIALQTDKPADFCSKSSSSEIECSWHHTTGTTKHTECGDRHYDEIGGSFRYQSGDTACAAACEELGKNIRTPSDFCEEGALASIVDKCEKASESLKNSGTPPDWCAASFTTPIMFTEPVVTETAVAISLADDICDKAYKQGCWEKGAFKSCCGKCNADKGSLTCHWDFTGSPEFDGDTCKSPGINIVGEFDIDMHDKETQTSCRHACDYLSQQLKTKSDLCAASQEVVGCHNAYRSVTDQLKKTGLCTLNEEMAELNAISLGAHDDCKAAYAQGCWKNKSGFSDCCAQCSAGSSGSTCNWNYAEVADELHIGDNFLLDSEDCNKVCKLMSSSSRTRHDYCPGGDIYEAATKCPSAYESIKRTVSSSFCQNHNKTQVKCDWHYSFYSNNKKEFKDIDGELFGSFSYLPGDTTCETSCAALSYFNNVPQQYCITPSKTDAYDRVWQIINGTYMTTRQGTKEWRNGCPNALNSLKNAVTKNQEAKKLQKMWCSLDPIDVFGGRLPNDMKGELEFYTKKKVEIADMDRELQDQKHIECKKSFNQGCYNPSIGEGGDGRKAFNQCCHDCLMKTSKMSTKCEWSVNSRSGIFRYNPEQDFSNGNGCFKMCIDLRDTIPTVQGYCHNLPNNRVSKYSIPGQGSCISGYNSVTETMPSTLPECAPTMEVVLN